MKKLIILTLVCFSCTSGRDLGYVYGNLEPAYYPKRFHIPGLVDVQANSKRTRILKKDWELIDLHHDISNQRFKNDKTGARTVGN